MPKWNGVDRPIGRGGRDMLEVHDPEQRRDDRADDDADEDRDVGEEAAGPTDQSEDHEQRMNERQGEPRQRAVGRVADLRDLPVQGLAQRRQASPGPG